MEVCTTLLAGPVEGFQTETGEFYVKLGGDEFVAATLEGVMPEELDTAAPAE